MFQQIKITLLILKFQIRTLGFLTPVILIPIIYIQYSYVNNGNLMALPFLFLQSPFINPSAYYNLPDVFRQYFKVNNIKLTLAFSTCNLILYNVFYLIGLLTVRNNKLLRLSKEIIKFESLLLIALIIGSILYINIINEHHKVKQKLLISKVFFTIFYIFSSNMLVVILKL